MTGMAHIFDNLARELHAAFSTIVTKPRTDGEVFFEGIDRFAIARGIKRAPIIAPVSLVGWIEFCRPFQIGNRPLGIFQLV